jgi:hypothetical protein
VSHQPAISFSISFQHHFNRAGGRTFNVRQTNFRNYPAPKFLLSKNMPLIPCPECSLDVSTQASSCPKCGCPISSARGGNRIPRKLWIASGIFAIVLIAYYTNRNGSKPVGTTEKITNSDSHTEQIVDSEAVPSAKNTNPSGWYYTDKYKNVGLWFGSDGTGISKITYLQDSMIWTCSEGMIKITTKKESDGSPVVNHYKFEFPDKITHVGMNFIEYHKER